MTAVGETAVQSAAAAADPAAARPIPALAGLASAMAAYRQLMLESLMRLCRIPSCKGEATAKAPYGEQTVRALDAFLDIGRQLGFTAVNLDNRAGYVEFGSAGPLVGVLGHLDVVPAGTGWATDPFEPTIVGDRVIGRGVLDDKGPVVAALYAMKALADESFHPQGRIRLIVGLDEESGSSCMAHYVQVAELPAVGFTPDANFPVIYAEKGILWLKINLPGGQPASDVLRLVAAAAGERPNMVPGECRLVFEDAAHPGAAGETLVTGRSAHASMPWEGGNAIAAAMTAARDRLMAAGCRHPFVDFFLASIGDSWRGEGLTIAGRDESGELTLNAGLLQLDPAGANLTLDIRYPVTWTAEQVLGPIRTRVEAAGGSVSVVQSQQPLHMAKDSPLVSKLMAVYQELTGTQIQPLAIGGGTYARTMPNIVAFGPLFPGNAEMAHKTGEYLSVQSFLAMAAVYREALRSLAGPGWPVLPQVV